jgi:flavin reductase (DIM6/NTAB) family NADH-FMN oxidoreductase RutF
MGSFPTGVTVVTVASDDSNMHGITVNSFSSVSLDPMLVLVCINETSRGISLLAHAGMFVVNVLSAGQQDVSRWFANRDRPAGSTMFDGVPFEPGVTGCPVLVGATASFECRLRQSHRAGDHLIVLGQVVALVHRPQLEPLIFHAGSYKSLEHEPLSDIAQLHVDRSLSADTAAKRGGPARPRRPLARPKTILPTKNAPGTLADLTRCEPETTFSRHPDMVPAASRTADRRPLTWSDRGPTLAKGRRFAFNTSVCR